mmetsp:Transcript_2939/g.18457  ORF Transcript_2939/g.18457 Transcript_2939/m.18457 type:complete len:377 (+) Transcript_2939:3180-4310(+)
MDRAIPNFQLHAHTHLPQFCFHPQGIIHEHFFRTAMNHGRWRSPVVTKQRGCHGVAQALGPLHVHPRKQTPLESDVTVLEVGGESSDFDPQRIEQLVCFVVDGDGLSSDGQIGPWRERDRRSGHGDLLCTFLVFVFDQEQSGKHESSTRRVSGKHDVFRQISLFQQPFIDFQRIFHCTWKRMQRCQSIIHSQHGHFGRGGHPRHHLSMCEQRAAHVSSAMQVQHHVVWIRRFGTQPFARHAVCRHLLHFHARNGQVCGVSLRALQRFEVEGASHGSMRRHRILHGHDCAHTSTSTNTSPVHVQHQTHTHHPTCGWKKEQLVMVHIHTVKSIDTPKPKGSGVVEDGGSGTKRKDGVGKMVSMLEHGQYSLASKVWMK